LGGQPVGFRRPSWFSNLPITVSGLPQWGISLPAGRQGSTKLATSTTLE